MKIKVSVLGVTETDAKTSTWSWNGYNHIHVNVRADMCNTRYQYGLVMWIYIVGTGVQLKRIWKEVSMHVYTCKHMHTHILIYVRTLICRVGSCLNGFLLSAVVVSCYKRNIATVLFEIGGEIWEIFLFANRPDYKRYVCSMLDATSGRDTSGSLRALQRLSQDGGSPEPFPYNHLSMTSFKHSFTSLEQFTLMNSTSSCGSPNTSPRSSHSETIPFSARLTLR